MLHEITPWGLGRKLFRSKYLHGSLKRPTTWKQPITPLSPSVHSPILIISTRLFNLVRQPNELSFY